MPGIIESNGFTICHVGDQPGGEAIVICHGGYRARVGSRPHQPGAGKDWEPPEVAVQTKIPARAGTVHFYAEHGRPGVVGQKKAQRLLAAGDVATANEKQPAGTVQPGTVVANYRLYYDKPLTDNVVSSWPDLPEADGGPMRDLITRADTKTEYRHLSTLWFTLWRRNIQYNALHVFFCRVPTDRSLWAPARVGDPVARQ